jgi:hypothetical protein
LIATGIHKAVLASILVRQCETREAIIFDLRGYDRGLVLDAMVELLDDGYIQELDGKVVAIDKPLQEEKTRGSIMPPSSVMIEEEMMRRTIGERLALEEVLHNYRKQGRKRLKEQAKALEDFKPEKKKSIKDRIKGVLKRKK